MSEEASSPNKILRVVLLLLACIGMGASIWLVDLHWTAHVNPGATSICSVSKGVNCLNVAESSYAVLLGVPVAVWTLLTYLLLFTIVLSPMARKGKGPRFSGLTFLIAVFSVIGTIAFALISMLKINTFCIACGILYVVNPNLALFSWLTIRKEGSTVGEAVRADFGWLTRPASNGILVASFGVLVAAGLMVVYPNYWSTPEPGGPGKLPHGITKKGHPWIGAKKPVLTIYEMSDYECGFCRNANKHMRKILNKPEFSKVVRLVHLNYPLDKACNPLLDREFHKRACELARAAYCASKQGKAWHFHDMIFRRQQRGGANIRSITLKLGMDVRKHEACMESKATKKKIVDELAEAEAMAQEATGQGVRGTPSFFFRGPDGKLRRGSSSENHIRETLKRFRAKSGPKLDKR